MADREIVARLTLNGQQFRSQNAILFGEMERAARDTASRTRNAFESSFSEIQRLAAKALAAPRTQSGALDLGVDQYRQAAAAAELQAGALRDIAVAAEAAALANRDNSENTRLYVQAARAAALEAENDARAKGQQVVATERLQEQMNRMAGASRVAAGGQQVLAGSSRQSSMAMIQASQQAQDFAIQVQMGTPIMTAFAQQGSQMAFVLSGLQGKVGAVARVLSGPYGIAILGVTTLIGAYIASVKRSGEENEKSAPKVKSLTERLKEQNEQLERNIRSQERLAVLTKISASGELETAREDAAKARRALADAERAAAAQRAAGERFAGMSSDPLVQAQAESIVDREVIARRQELATALDRVAEAQRGVRMAQVLLLDNDLEARFDKNKAVTREFTLAMDSLREAFARGSITQEEYLRRQTQLIAQREKAMKALREEAKQKGPDASNIAGTRILAAAQGYVGLNERRDGNVLRDLFKQANADVDPKMVAWCAAFVNAVLATQGLPGTGALNARSFLNYGSNVDKPEKGDIVILKGAGGPASGHVGFFAGFDAKGGVRVTGGNQSDQVSTQTFKQSQVLGFRRAPDAGDVYADQQKQAEQLAEDAVRLGKSLTEQTTEMQEQLRIDDLRRKGLDVEADVQEAINRRLAANSAIAGKTVEQLMEQTGWSREIAQARLDELATLKKQDEVRVRLAAADVAAKQQTTERIAVVEEAIKAAEAEMGRVDQIRRQQVDDLADFYHTAFSDGADGIWRDFKDQGLDAIALIAAQWTLAMLSGQQMSFGGVLGSLNTGSGSGNAFIGALSNLLSKSGKIGGPHVGTYGDDHGETEFGGRLGSVASTVERASDAGWLGSTGIGGALTKAVPYIGVALAALPLITGLFGGLFGSVKKGSASLGFDQYGDLGVTSTTGNSKKRIAAASSAVDSLAGTLEGIAETLGGTLGGTPSVSIGMRKKDWRVDPSGMGRTKGSGVVDFDDDQEAAVRFAISEALKDGVVQGISDASQRILQSGQDLERAITKAAMIEEIPKLLKARLDPVGAALDELNDRWEKVWDALEEGAASAEQMAEAQQLYNLELKETKESVRATSDALKSFLDDLRVGPSSPYSLRDQEAAAVAVLQPYLDQINTGKAIDQQKYLEVAQNYLDIERQLYGSTSQFFAAMDQVQAATNAAIAQIDNAAPIATAADPFIKETASNTKATADISAEARDINVQIRDRLDQLIALQGGGGSFIAGDPRAYASL